MPASYSQRDRPLRITTPLGADVLLLARIQGTETLSALFQFELEMLSERPNDVAFAKLLGQPVTVTIQVPGSPIRHINGIVTRLVQGGQVLAGNTTLVEYRATLVPRFWLLTKRRQNRIFQQLSIPDILKQVLSAIDVHFQLTGSYSPRDYCVQYRVGLRVRQPAHGGGGHRLLFQHTDDGHTLVVTDSATSFQALPGASRLTYERLDSRGPGQCCVWEWEKAQDLVSGQYLLQDHCFELQDHNLEAANSLTGSVAVGTESQTLAVGPAHDLALADYPGEYAQRFDGMTSDGQPQPDSLTEIFADGERTVRIRMEQEAALCLQVRGASDYSHLLPGYTFTLEKHFNGDGDYLATKVEHQADIRSAYLTGEEPGKFYRNRLAGMPVGLTYRPQRVTPRPKIDGTQSATVVGPAGQPLFCDKYGRVKVQFRWDRQGQNNATSSCWLQVAALGGAGIRWLPPAPRRAGSCRRLRGRRSGPADRAGQRFTTA